MSIAKGQVARQIVPVIQGVCVGKRFNEDTDKFECLVDYTNKDGQPEQRWFAESELELVEAT